MALQVAVANNPHLPKYLRGLKRMPRDKPSRYGIGSIEEAIVYMELYSKCWNSTPGALDWLASRV